MNACHLLLAASLPSWTIVCGGDLMFNGIKPGTASLSGVARVMKEADIAVANLEIPLCSTKERTTRKTRQDVKAKKQFVLTASPKHISELVGAGIDLVSLGNNHAMDAGPSGLKEMMQTLARNRIFFAGAGMTKADAEKPAVATLPDGTRVGLVSYLAFMGDRALWTCGPASDSGAGVATLAFGGVVGSAARNHIEEIVVSAKKGCDVLLVALHWGIERQLRPTSYQVALGRAFIDAGADAVLGSHPHVLQGIETRGGRPILYSMGNLVSPKNGSTALYRLTFRNRRCTAVEAVPVQIKGGKATLVPVKLAEAAGKKIEALDRLIPQNKKGPRPTGAKK